jgi:hypothetical protein
MMIDSLDTTAADRAIVVDECRQASKSRLLITHGTDTMVAAAAGWQQRCLSRSARQSC